MSKIVKLDDHRPHKTLTVVCDKCSHVWQAVAPRGTKSFECPKCSAISDMPDIHTCDEDTSAGDTLTDCADGGGGCCHFKDDHITGQCGNAASSNYSKTISMGFADGHCPDHSEL